MSRRNNVTDPVYGQIKLKCPRGHEAGVILVQPRRPIRGRQALYRLGAVLKAPKIESPEENIVHEGRMEWGRTVGADCEICGRPYWTFWETVEPEIAKLADTPVVTLTLDDDPLC
jgi:hypothetical protein